MARASNRVVGEVESAMRKLCKSSHLFFLRTICGCKTVIFMITRRKFKQNNDVNDRNKA